MLKRLEAAGRRALAKHGLSRFQPDHVLEKIPGSVRLNRILLMRWDAIGDMMVSLPLFRKVRELFPEAEIGIVVSKRNLPLLKHEEGFYAILYDSRPSIYLRSLIIARRFRPDVIVDTRMHYDSTTSFIYGVVSGATLRLSASNRDNRLPFSVRVPMPEGKHHYAHLTKILLEGLGRNIDDSELDRKLRLSTEETEFADAFWREAGLSLRNKVIGVNISAGNPSRIWGTDHTAELCSFIVNTGNIPLVFFTPDDRCEAALISDAVPGTMVIPECSTVLHVAALVKDVKAMVTPDTALVHIAASYEIPVLGLFPQREGHMPLWYPWGVKHELIRTHTGRVEDISEQDVIAGYVKLLKGIPSHF
ncbi:MAG: glycosyltransferase family 9 protein [Candidatus Aegiribacteria sp.]|nr:glycosyltransferase family 9 protein [Candidatus Aegiribacteria sp.]